MFKGYSIADPSASTLAPYVQLRNVITKYDATSNPDGSAQGLVDIQCFGAVASEQQAACKQQRNEAIAGLVIGSETACLQHRRSIYGNDAGTNIALGTAAGLFAGWASVLTNTHPYRSSILGALSLFATSERALVNETVYKTMIVTAVDQKIMEARSTRAQAIQGKFNQGIDSYSMNQALSDWVDFHNACSFMTGLQLALAEGTQGTNAQKVLRLRANLDAAQSQYASQSCAAKDPNDPFCKALAAQIKALGDSLTAASTQ
jgi:hypothetical protein